MKGAVGSFSRGGLMVTHDGRVIYKINQDRGLISHPSLSKAKHTVFGIFDGERTLLSQRKRTHLRRDTLRAIAA